VQPIFTTSGTGLFGPLMTACRGRSSVSFQQGTPAEATPGVFSYATTHHEFLQSAI
jgi:hypothetical protein